MRTFVNPAGQAAAPAVQATAQTPATAPPVTVGSDGRVSGIDGLLDQIAGAAMRQAQPIIANTILPAIQNDPALQKNLGEGIGRGIGQRLSAPAWLAAGALGILAVAAVVYVVRSHPAPRRSVRKSSRRSSRS